MANDPPSSETAAHASFALLEALLNHLVATGALTSEHLVEILATAAEALEQSSNQTGSRAADFIRNITFGKQ